MRGAILNRLAARLLLFTILIAAIFVFTHTLQRRKELPGKVTFVSELTTTDQNVTENNGQKQRENYERARSSAIREITREEWSKEISAVVNKISDAVTLQTALHDVTMILLRDLLRGFNKAVLLDLALMENKGDPAITVGELNALAALNVTVLYYCYYGCSDGQFKDAREAADEYGPDEVVVLSHGGGNIGGYPFSDYKRMTIAKLFPDYKFIVFSQSTWFHTPGHLELVAKEYNAHSDMTIMLRDEISYNFTKEHFQQVQAVLAPDMAFSIDSLTRFLPPLYDVVWIHRADDESPGKAAVSFPPNVSYAFGDWFHPWPSPHGKNLVDRTYGITYNGFLYASRGKVLVTDRLHGHILAALLDLPTVIIDNKIKKLSSLRDTWTRGLKHVVMAKDSQDACVKAIQLLALYSEDTSFAPGVKMFQS